MKKYDRLKYALPPIITALLLFIIYAIKHIYPFGTATVDYYDMGQQIASFYYHTFDFLHGEKNLFYDAYTALSVNMAMSTSGCSHLSIFNLFFLFIRREMLLESLSWFLLLKMALMSLFMYIYIHGRYRVAYFYEVLLSVGYGFCGYVLTLYMTIQWLDVAALFPLLMLFLHRLLKDGKFYGYTSVLTMCLIASYYQSFMILMYIVIMTGAALLWDTVFLKLSKSESERIYENYHLPKLFFATVISLLISSFIVLPQIKQTLISSRFNNESEGGLVSMYLKIIGTYKPAYISRWFSLLLLSFPFAIIAYGLFRYRKEKKTVSMAGMVLLIILSELIVESVNLFWHFGSYVGYPIRNGYMIYFTVAVISCGFIQKLSADGIGLFRIDISVSGNGNEEKIEKNSILKGKNLFVTGSVFASVMVIAVIITIYENLTGLTEKNVVMMTSAVMIMTFTVYLIITVFRNGRLMYLSSVLMTAEILLYGFVLIGKPSYVTGYTKELEQESDYIHMTDDLDREFGLNAVDNSDAQNNLMFKRVKNPDATLNANYPLVLRRPALSNWTHLLSPDIQRDAVSLGYSIQYTRVLDAGGTCFSDALLSVNSIISCQPLDESIYKLVGTKDITTDKLSGEKRTYYLYESMYSLPFGIVTDTADFGFEGCNTKDIYNALYDGIVKGKTDDSGNSSGDFAEWMSIDDGMGADGKTLKKSLLVDGKKALYYFSNQVDADDYNTEILVNGVRALVPSIKEYDNSVYPAHFNNNALYLGTFENEYLDIEITFGDTDKNGNPIEREFSPRILTLDMNKFIELTENYSDSVTYRSAGKSDYEFVIWNDAPSGEERYFLIPLSYDEGYSALVNGNSTDVIPVSGLFTAVKLVGGENRVTVSFVPSGMKTGIIISVIGTLLLCTIIVFDRRSDLLNRDFRWLDMLYAAAFCIAFLAMYAASYLSAVIMIITGR